MKTILTLCLLLGAACASPAIAGTVNYTYDDAGRLTRAAYANGTVINYTYDKAGNLLSRMVGTTAAPVITAVINGASYQPGIAAAMWINIKGTSLSSTTRIWGATDFVNGNLPLQLDGVSATVNGLAGYVYYVSPTQINVLAPDDSTVGQVQVQVTTGNGKSNSFAVAKAAVSPAFFPFTPKYPAAVHANGVYVGAPGLIAGGNFAPGKPGETIELFGTGFGPTNPPIPGGKIVTTAEPLANSVTVTIGGQAVTPAFAGVTYAGLDQINVKIPAGLPDGDATLVATVSGVSTPAGVFLTIHH